MENNILYLLQTTNIINLLFCATTTDYSELLGITSIVFDNYRRRNRSRYYNRLFL